MRKGDSKASQEKSSAAKPRKTKKPTPLKLRIIGGQMRGRSIEYHGELFTRPMKDNIRENLFNILHKAIRGSIGFDLFAGTGALAIESLSRGAVAAVAIEQSKRAAGFIRRSAETLGIESKLQVIVGDTFRLNEKVLMPAEDLDDPLIGVPWVVYLCPPYALWEEELVGLNQIIQRVQRLAPPGSVLVVETEKSFDIGRLPPGDWDVRVYGGTQLAFIEPAMCCGLSE